MESSQKIYELFERYLNQKDFVGADMARKFLQMGYTRARRYANHPSGRKYKDNDKNEVETKSLPYPYSSGSRNKQNGIIELATDRFENEKAKAAEIFRVKWQEALHHPLYQKLKTEHEQNYGK